MYQSWSGSTPLLYEDLRFPAQATNPPGAESDPSRNSTTGLLEFAGNADNIIVGIAQLPHTWKKGSTLHPHLHLNFPTSAAKNTRWQFGYNIADMDGAFAAGDIGNWTSLDAVTVTNPQDTDKHVYADLGNIPMTGYLVSCCIHWKVARLASSDGDDDDTNACALLEFDIHYQLDSEGSRTELVK